MLNDLQFYEIDLDYLGEESGDEGGENKNDGAALTEREKLLRMSMNDEDEKELNPMEAALQVFSEDYRKE